MRAVWRITWLWPGLTRLWFQGEWTGLAQAVAFAVLVNLALFARWIRPDLVPPSIGFAAGALALGIWAMGLLHMTRRGGRRSDPVNPDNPQDLFLQAQEEYLKGNWSEAEAIARSLLRDNPRDSESHLLLASIFRRTDRLDSAHRSLRQAEQADEDRTWSAEIQRELDILERLAQGSD